MPDLIGQQREKGNGKVWGRSGMQVGGRSGEGDQEILGRPVKLNSTRAEGNG